MAEMRNFALYLKKKKKNSRFWSKKIRGRFENVIDKQRYFFCFILFISYFLLFFCDESLHSNIQTCIESKSSGKVMNNNNQTIKHVACWLFGWLWLFLWQRREEENSQCLMFNVNEFRKKNHNVSINVIGVESKPDRREIEWTANSKWAQAHDRSRRKSFIIVSII